jgi:hypothetical protein
MTNMLHYLQGKVDSMHEQLGNVSREMEMVRKNQKDARNQNYYHRNKQYL